MNTHYLIGWAGIAAVMFAGALGAVRVPHRYGLQGKAARFYKEVRNVFLALGGIALLVGIVTALVL